MDQDRLRICATSRAKYFQNMTCPALQTLILRSVRLQFLIRYSKPAVTSFFFSALNKIILLTLSCHDSFLLSVKQLYQSKMGLEPSKTKSSEGLSPTSGFPFQKLHHSHSAGETYHRPVMVCRSLVWGSWSSVQLLQGRCRFLRGFMGLLQVKPHAFVFIRITIHLIIDTDTV